MFLQQDRRSLLPILRACMREDRYPRLAEITVPTFGKHTWGSSMSARPDSRRRRPPELNEPCQAHNSPLADRRPVYLGKLASVRRCAGPLLTRRSAAIAAIGASPLPHLDRCAAASQDEYGRVEYGGLPVNGAVLIRMNWASADSFLLLPRGFALTQPKQFHGTGFQ